jgi:hypothetical protein
VCFVLAQCSLYRSVFALQCRKHCTFTSLLHSVHGSQRYRAVRCNAHTSSSERFVVIIQRCYSTPSVAAILHRSSTYLKVLVALIIATTTHTSAMLIHMLLILELTCVQHYVAILQVSDSIAAVAVYTYMARSGPLCLRYLVNCVAVLSCSALLVLHAWQLSRTDTASSTIDLGTCTHRSLLEFCLQRSFRVSCAAQKLHDGCSGSCSASIITPVVAEVLSSLVSLISAGAITYL